MLVVLCGGDRWHLLRAGSGYSSLPLETLLLVESSIAKRSVTCTGKLLWIFKPKSCREV